MARAAVPAVGCLGLCAAVLVHLYEPQYMGVTGVNRPPQKINYNCLFTIIYCFCIQYIFYGPGRPDFGESRNKYKAFVEKGILDGKKPELTGGGLIRSAGGRSVLKSLRKMNIYFKSDERILGDSDFVEKVLNNTAEKMESKYRLKAMGYGFTLDALDLRHPRLSLN